jgi:hypothetical protein
MVGLMHTNLYAVKSTRKSSVLENFLCDAIFIFSGYPVERISAKCMEIFEDPSKAASAELGKTLRNDT